MPEIGRDELYREIGRRLREVRESHSPKITQADLAKRLEVERTSISNIEKGLQRATIHFLYSAAEVLNEPLYKFLPDLKDPRIHKVSLTSLFEVDGLDEQKTKTVTGPVKSLYDTVFKGDE